MARDDASDTDLGRRAARPGRPLSQVEAGGPSPSGGLGIALNGGGLRAPIVASGFLRGLHHIGVLEKASHVSGISGGSIAAAIVSYSPTDLNDLLAMDRLPSPPGSIPDYQNGQGKLGEIGEKALHRVLAGPALKQSAASNLPSLAGSVCCGGVPAAMRTALNEAILAPHGVDGTKPPAAQSDAREGVTATIPGRPEPIISFCMASPEWPDNLSHIERVRRANAATLGRLGINSDGEKYSLEEVVEAARAERAAVAGASAVMFDLGGARAVRGRVRLRQNRTIGGACFRCRLERWDARRRGFDGGAILLRPLPAADRPPGPCPRRRVQPRPAHVLQPARARLLPAGPSRG